MMTPIETAVAPLKQKAIDSAEVRANQIVMDVVSDLETVDFEIEKVAPYPKGWGMGQMQRARMNAKYSLYRSITSEDLRGRRYVGYNEPHYVKIDDKKVARFIQEMKEMAAAQYEAFVAKLITKVGDHTGATLSTPSGVWDYSYVLVTKADGTTENWKTQCISKYSKLGKFFHQWPTRMLKPGSKR
jgi:hypothetical protein